MRRWRSAIASFALVALLPAVGFATATSADAANPVTRISSDPYRDADAQHQTQVEPSAFAFGNTIVSAFQSGRVFSGGASNIGFATSTDRGRSWTHGFLPRTTGNASPKGPYASVSDASVAYDARHRAWIISYLGIRNGTNAPVDVLSSRSTDGGKTWGAPKVVFANGQFLDKNWTTCDNTPRSTFYGNCYTEFDDNTLNDLIVLSTSTDGGRNWADPVATPDQSEGLGGEPVVLPDGTLVVPYLQLNNPSPVSGAAISSFSSHDGGVTLTRSTVISPANAHAAAGNLRGPDDSLPSARVDGSGRVYVVWNDCRFEPSCNANDLLLSTSTNGTRWSVGRRIPVDPVGKKIDHFLPGLGVDPASGGRSAKLGLTYYYYPNANCNQSTCQLDVGFISSTDSGKSWSNSSFVAGPMKLTWLANTSQGRMVGDYMATAVSPGGTTANGIIEIAHKPGRVLFDEATYDARFAITGGTTPLGTESAAAGVRPNAVPAPGAPARTAR